MVPTVRFLIRVWHVAIAMTLGLAACPSLAAQADERTALSYAVPAVKPLLWDGTPDTTVKMYALVVGMADYKHSENMSLPAARNDATRMAAILKRYGYHLIGGEAQINLTAIELRQRLNELRESAQGADSVLVYFSGHGVQEKYTNMLVPTDFRTERSGKLDLSSLISLNDVLKSIEGNGAQRNIVVLDMCRVIPKNLKINSAFARLPQPPEMTLIGFASGSGTYSYANGSYSYYTNALIKEMDAHPFDDFERILLRVRDSVVKETKSLFDRNGKPVLQEPVFTGGILSLGRTRLLPEKIGTLNEKAISKKPKHCEELDWENRIICYLAASGYARFQYLMATRLRQGDGLAKDKESSQEWYLRAAQQGYFPALYWLGLKSTETGEYRKLIHYLMPIAKAGYANASTLISSAYDLGEDDVPVNPGLAVWHLQQAAEQGDTDALSRLAIEYYFGKKVGRNCSLAIDLAEEASERGDHVGYHLLGRIYFEEVCARKDHRKTREYWTEEVRRLEGLFNSGSLDLKGMDPDEQEALLSSYNNLAVMMDGGMGGPVDHIGAEHLRSLSRYRFQQGR